MKIHWFINISFIFLHHKSDENFQARLTYIHHKSDEFFLNKEDLFIVYSS